MAGVLPDGKWLEAFTLPARVIAALFAAFVALFVLEKWLATPTLSAIVGPAIGNAIVWIGLVVFGALTAGNIGAAVGKRGQAYLRKRTADTKAAAQAKKRKELLLGRLDHLSNEELFHIGTALKKGGQSFYGYVHNPALATLMEKLLLQTPGGTHHQDHYPYTFPDYVWEELQRRKDEFIAKGDEAQKKMDADRRRI